MDKRKRSVNWTEDEKKILRMLVLKRVDIIENKECSTNTNNAKKHAWEEVLSSFNAISPFQRDLPQLLNQWRGMKNKAKKSGFEYRRARNGTGGGPPPDTPPAEDLELMEAIPHEFEIDSNMFDSDQIYRQQISSQQTPQSNEIAGPEKQNSPQSTLVDEVNIKKPVQQTSSSTKLIHVKKLVMLQKPITLPTRLPKTPTITEKKPTISKRLQLAPTETPTLSEQSSINKVKPADKAAPEKRRTNKKFKACCSDSHEHELFMVSKRSREECIRREEELHQRRLSILKMEEDYWKLKIEVLKQDLKP